MLLWYDKLNCRNREKKMQGDKALVKGIHNISLSWGSCPELS